MTIKQLFADLEKAKAARAALLSLRAEGVPFSLATEQVARATGITTEETARRIEGWEELTGIKLER